MKNIFLSFILLFISISAFSQKNDTCKVYPLSEVVVSSIRGDEKTPLTQSYINKQIISDIFYGQEFPFIVNTTPSVISYADGGNFNGYSYFTLRGIDQTRINMTLNGIPLNEPEDQGAYFTNYPDFLSNIGSIQIQRGVGTSTNGSASYGGSINFTSDDLIDTSYSNLQLTIASFKTEKASYMYNSGLKSNLSYSLRLSDISSDGYRNNSGINGGSLFFNSQYNLKDGYIKVIAFSGTEKSQMAYIPSDSIDIIKNRKSNPLSPDETDHFTQSLISAQYIVLVNNWLINNTIFYNKLVGDYGVKFDSLHIYDYSLNSNFYGHMFSMSYYKNNFKFIFGTMESQYNRTHEISLEPFVSEKLYSNIGYKYESNKFIKIERTYDDITLYGDIQNRSTSFNYNNDTSINWNFWNPKGGISVKINKNSNLYFSVGKTDREPTRLFMFGGRDSINSNNYKSIKTITESLIDYEVGYITKSKYIDLSCDLYHMDFKNQILPTGQFLYGMPTYMSVSKSYREGFEISLKLKFNKFILFNTSSFSNNMIHIDAKGITGQDSSTDGKALLSPKFNIINGIIYNINKKITLNINERYISKSYLSNLNKYHTLPSSDILSIYGSYNIKSNIKFIFCINNILNSKYFTYGNVDLNTNQAAFWIGSPRNYSLSCNYTF